MNAPPKADPDTLVLKAPPRPTIRFKRKLLIGMVAIGSAAIFGVTWLALKGTSPSQGQSGQELYNTDHKTVADGLASLPGSYAQMKPDTPPLGPPLPGDLGRPIMERQRQLGLASSVDQAAEAEKQRLAQQSEKAREAGVFFQVTARQAPVGPSQARAGGGEQTSPSTETPRLNLDPTKDQNNQQRKLDFLSQKPEAGIYNPHRLQTPVSPYQVMAGSVIAASLITGLDSDLPGFVVAQVTENVYDSVTGQILLIPQGSRLVGSYDSVVAFGQSRALLVWQRIILPNGSSIQIDNLPATDTAGYAGLSDGVDYHTWQLLMGVAMSTLLGVGTEIGSTSNQSNTQSGVGASLVQAIRQSTQQSVNQAGQRIVEKNLNIQPTLTVRPGWPLRVVIHKDLVLNAYTG